MKNILKPSMSVIAIAFCGLALTVTCCTVWAQSTYQAAGTKEPIYSGGQALNNQAAGDTAKSQGVVIGIANNSTNQANPVTRTRKLPQELQSSSSDGANNSPKTRTETADLSCSRAVDNARSGVESMLELAQKNFKAGYMEKPEYEAGAKGLLSIMSRLSTTECQTSTGSVRSFYQCMSGEHSHVAACGQKYSYQ
jgi:hypothetical protein